MKIDRNLIDALNLILLIINCVAFFIVIIIPENAYEPHVTHAYDSCEPNGGLEKIELDPMSLEAHCVNGAMFRIGNTNEN